MSQPIRTNNGSKRVMAYCIDILIIVAYVLICTAISTYAGPIATTFICLIGIVLYLLIPLLLWTQTLGKKAAKIKVAKLNDEDINKSIIIAREFTKYGLTIITCGIYVLVSGIMVLSRDDEFAPHDIIFHCHIIDTTLKQKIEARKYHEEEGFKF